MLISLSIHTSLPFVALLMEAESLRREQAEPWGQLTTQTELQALIELRLLPIA